ncbi:ACP phosphodiesterase [Paracoccus sp. S-4012]|uniref:NADPH-dependent FMN reductase n=1 Tax=Paracoccus sp. S-4012 TaxID=2665648 RepID=UPI0012AFD8C5|nr:NAD(P)H-dependent oxidoreductase [Paracoccus sp. S-4012]MRX51970.1 ACP phosphodiesterase [Paracoccus sp. S-4012]
MADNKNVGVLVGSLRKDSYALKLAKALMRLAPSSLQMTQIQIGDMPHYNEDLDTDNPPESWARFRREMGAQDAVLFVSPEYNRSLPSVLKNAIDVGSRPYGSSIWEGKAGAVATHSPSGIGGALSNHAIRQATVFLGLPLMTQPEMYIGDSYNVFDKEGNIVKDGSEKFLSDCMATFETWLQRF